MSTAATIRCADVRFVKELYPRLREDDAAIERYRASIDRLPPIVIARDGILVDGYHRWQAHKRENITEINAEDLGNISDAEILTHSYRLNATHGKQLSRQEKISAACHLYFTLPGTDDERYETIADVLSLNLAVARRYAADAKRETERQKRERAWDLWLDCWTQQAIADEIGVPQRTIADWLADLERNSNFAKPPGATDAEPWGHIQHFDIWQFARADGESSHFGRMPPQIVENLLWGTTNPGDIVVDPFAGGGTTIDVAKAMGRRVWASDITPRSEMLPIHQHNILDGWPSDAPSRANLILLDPPYWRQAKGEYSDNAADFANMSLDDFYDAWASIIRSCVPHLAKGNGDGKEPGRIAYIISPTQCGGTDDVPGPVIDHATDMLCACDDAGLKVERRIIVPYQTQQSTGQQVIWARDNKRWLKLYRDLIILRVRE